MRLSKLLLWGDALIVALVLAAPGGADAGPMRERIEQRRHDQGIRETEGLHVQRDVAYGSDPAQRFDVYLPDKPTGPVILMVHGGGWAHGDKSNAEVVVAKAKHFLSKGYVFISTNYRMLPQAEPAEQAADVARALAFAQKQASSWGADPSRFVLMGHSAGAHLVALLNANPALATKHGAQAWRGTVSLDSGTLDVEETMRSRHAKLFDDAFGSDRAAWRAVSPLHQLTQSAPPLLAVCSSNRRNPCREGGQFRRKAESMGLKVELMPVPMSHMQVNAQVGVPGDYTDSLSRWISSIL